MKNHALLMMLLAGGIFVASCDSKSEKKDIEKNTVVFAEKDGEKLQMDIFRDAADVQSGSQPVFIFSFGGAWVSGSRHTGRKLLKDCARQGYIGIGIDYRLGIKQLKDQGVAIDSSNFASSYSQAIMMGVEDLYDATRYVIDHARELRADTSRIVICGSSAGAINSLTAEYLVCNSHPLATEKLPEGFNYAAVVPFAGGIWLADTDTLIWKRKPCPILAYHGTADQLVPYGKSVIGNGAFGAFGPDYFIPQLKQMEVSFLFHQYHRADHMISGWGDNELAREEMQRELDRMLDTTQHVAVTTSEEYYGPAPSMEELIKAWQKATE